MCNSGISADSLIPVFIREGTSRRPDELPQRPTPQRQEPVVNHHFNPVKPTQFRVFDAQNVQREDENIPMTAGFGFFPPIAMLLATSDFTSGESGYAPLDVVTFRQIMLSSGIVGFFLIFFSMVF